MEKNLPAYAHPIFIRVQKTIEKTSTFKFKKVELVNEGYDIVNKVQFIGIEYCKQ